MMSWDLAPILGIYFFNYGVSPETFLHNSIKIYTKKARKTLKNAVCHQAGPHSTSFGTNPASFGPNSASFGPNSVNIRH